MAGKRNAGSDLNHDNWDDDYEHEEAGTFKRAPEDVISKRVIKTARRRNPIGSGESGKSPTNAFSSFGGFSKTATPASVSSASPFAFLSTFTPPPPQNNTNGLSPNILISKTNTTTNPLFNISSNKESPEKCSTYLDQLQNLNESVTEWIKIHVDKNPYCLLTPIFKDYETHLTAIESLKKSPEKPDEIKPDFKLSSDDKTSQASTHSASIFGKSDNKKEGNSFLSTKMGEKPKENSSTTTFTFGNTKLPTAPTSGFTFGATGPPFQFSNVAKPAEDNKKEEMNNDEEEEPPTNDFTPVVEDNNVFTKRCKVFIKKDGAFADRGVGQLFLKPVENSEKMQLIVRQDTSLGNLLLNLILSKSIPTQRMGKNNVMLVCIPDEKSKPPPIPVLLRVKTAAEADELLGILEKHKK